MRVRARLRACARKLLFCNIDTFLQYWLQLFLGEIFNISPFMLFLIHLFAILIYDFVDKWLFLPLFLLSAFAIMYITFFAIGQTVSDGLIWLVERCVESPLSWALGKVVKAQWLLDLFDNGVCEALNSVLSFVFPVCLLYVFLGLIEDSGIMSRIAFMLDDSLSRVGLNGKSAYTLLLGFGCNTTAIITASGMPNKNAQTKTAILTPFM